jgi:multiple sugar transport system substrate-binding protein
MLVIALAFSFSCQQQNNEPAASRNNISDQVQTISFRITWTDYSGRGQAIQKIVDAYNAVSTLDTYIQLIGGDEDTAAIQTVLDTDPEIVLVLPYRHVQYFGDQGSLTDLTSAFSGDKTLFYPEVWDLGSVSGITYGIPWLGHSMCLLYNKTLLEKAGVDPASIKSLESLVSAFDTVEQKTGAKGIGLVGADSNDVSWMVNQFIYGFGGHLVNTDGKSVAVNSPQSAEALDFYKNVLGKHAQESWVNDTGVEVMEYFRNQQVAFEIQGIWGVTDVQKNGSPFEVGAIPLKDIGVCAEVGPMMLTIPANMSEDGKQDAIRFIRYMISFDAQSAILNGEYSPEYDTYYPFRTPIRIDMADAPIVKSNPIYRIFIEGFENPSVDVPVPKWQTVKTSFYQTGLHSVMTGELSIADFLQMIEINGNIILSAS